MRSPRSHCPLSGALDLVGDKWTLLILRDLSMGKSRYSEFEESPERVPSNLLASRLRMMVEEGLVEKALYSNHSGRFEYRLTPKGRGLLPAMHALARWAIEHVDGTAPPPGSFWNA
ncbi:MAG: helix-turn-helix domain-containing protein [Planctomycetota bacterium]